MPRIPYPTLDRRSALRLVTAVPLATTAAILAGRPRAATAADDDDEAAAAAARLAATDAAIAALVAGRSVTADGIKLKTPAIAENGNTVPLSIAVDSPMTADDFVTAIHLFAAGNPSPEIASFYFTPTQGRARVATRVRLARTQDVIAIAELSDDRVLRTHNEVKVTIGGCGG